LLTLVVLFALAIARPEAKKEEKKVVEAKAEV
jgi:hypothetical protein